MLNQERLTEMVETANFEGGESEQMANAHPGVCPLALRIRCSLKALKEISGSSTLKARIKRPFSAHI